MQDTISQKIEDLALLVMMLHDADTLGFAMVIENCEALRLLLDDSTADASLHKAIDYVCAHKNAAGPELFALLKDFVEACQEWLKDPTRACFPGERERQKSQTAENGGWENDLCQNFDPQLTRDFIEQHTSDLEEFELGLIATLSARGNVDEAEFKRALKSYLHNIKGDAGATGLNGIQRVTHWVEDLLVSSTVKELTETLISYKEWVVSCMEAIAQNKVPQQLSNAFIGEALQALSNRTEHATPKEPASEISPEPQDQESIEEYQISGDPDIINEFLAEADDHLRNVEGILIDQTGDLDTESVNSVFRAVHSIKGGSSYFNLVESIKSSHLLESLLDRVRKNDLAFDNELKNHVLAYTDLLQKHLAQIASVLTTTRKLRKSEEFTQFIRDLEELTNKSSSASTKMAPANKAPEPAPEPAEAQVAAPASAAPQTAVPARQEKLDIKTIVKVDLARLDHLIEYIGEMTVSASMLVRSCRTYLSRDKAVMNNAHQLEQICREIQDIGMGMRLVPIKGLLQKMSRLVWDTSRKIGKEITFQMEGEDTELDRTLIDSLADPLMHMVRNSIDHGIEMPDERLKSGKPRAGTIAIHAFHKGGRINIEIRDDGHGLDEGKILRKAIQLGRCYI